MSRPDNKGLVSKNKLIAIADAIRTKSEITNSLTLDEMVTAIDKLSQGKEEQEKSITITQNGTTDVQPDIGYALSKVTINTNVPSTSQSLYTIAGTPRVDLAGFNAHDIQLFITKMRQVLANVTNTGAKLYKAALIMGAAGATITYEETTAENFPIHVFNEYPEVTANDSVMLGLDISVASQLGSGLIIYKFVSANYPTWKIESKNHVVNIYVSQLLGSEKENPGTNDISVIINDGNDTMLEEQLTVKPAPYMSIIPVD